MSLLDELTSVHDAVFADPKNVDVEVRQRFWRIVSQVKRVNNPEEKVILKVTEIRNCLYEQKLGKPRSLKWLVLWFIAGTAGLIYYLSIVRTGLQYTENALHDLLFAQGLPGATIAGIIFLYYPFGRLLAGRVTGIRLDGITRDIYCLPTLRINYPSYLRALPPRREWFFFIAGYWTAFTALWVGGLGFILAREWVGIAFGIFLGFAETLGALSGGKWGGELGHFHRERHVVRDWKRALKRSE